MPETIVSIGSNQSIATVTPNSCSTVSAGLYDVTFSSTPSSDVAVGDIYVAQEETGAFTTYTFLLTQIDGSTYRLKYVVCDDGGMGSCGATSPCDIYTGSFETVAGTFKRAFSNLTEFEGMVDNTSDLYWGASDDLIGQMHKDDVTGFTDGMTIFDNKQSLNSVTLSVVESDRHTGTAETGVFLKPSAAAIHDSGIIQSGIDDFTLEWLDISLDGLNSKATNVAVKIMGAYGVGVDNNTVRNCLLHDKYGNPGSSGPRAIFGAHGGNAAHTTTVQNNIIYSFHETSNDTNIGVFLRNLEPGAVKVFNNTVVDLVSDGSSKLCVGVSFHGGSNDEIKNNIVADLSADGDSDHERAYLSYSALADVSNNLSDTTTDDDWNAADMGQSYGDTTALVDKTLVEIAFVSTTPTAESYLLETGSVAIQAGVDLGSTDNVNYDIKGFDRHANDVTWDIGAHQKSTEGGGGGGGGGGDAGGTHKFATTLGVG
jgi:hypothetical protein